MAQNGHRSERNLAQSTAIMRPHLYPVFLDCWHADRQAAQLASLSPFDIFIASDVGSNISRAMTGKVPFFASLAATLVVVMHRLPPMVTMRSNWISGFVKGKVNVLVRNGIIDHTAMRRHDASPEDIDEALRIQRLERPDQARLGHIRAWRLYQGGTA